MTKSTTMAFARPRGAANAGGAGEQRNRPPRHRMRGGDLPRGATPSAAGHAGAAHLAKMALFAFTLACAITCARSLGICASTTPAFADQTLRFQNGGTAEQHDDGTITGSVYVTAVWAGLGTSYLFTMPDGQTIAAHCIDFGLVDPADDYYNFTAYPLGDGTYKVHAHTNYAAYYQTPTMPRVAAAGAAVQRTQSDGSWRPDVVRTGMARVTKVSNNAALTNGLATYSLEGARFSIWLDEGCTQSVNDAVLTTDASGNTTPANLDAGTYWVREDVAPMGFAIDQTPRSFTVVPGETAYVTYEDVPLFEPPVTLIKKVDGDTGSTQGATSLAGAEFAVRYYDGYYSEGNLPASPTRSWVFRSNANGDVPFTNDAKVSGDALFSDAEGRPVLPLGTIAYQETKAPADYFLEGQTPSSTVNYQAPVHVLRIETPGTYTIPQVSDSPRRAGIAIQKHDDKTGGTPQGDASLAGIGFQVFNANAAAVVVNGVSYAPGAAIGDPLVTDALGRAKTPSDYLPLGTYEVREVSANASMRLTCQPQRITLTTNHTNTCVAIDAPFGDAVVRGGVRVHKYDAELNRGEAQADATLANATFSITLDSPNPVVVRNKTYSKGQVVMTLTTDEQGNAQTGAEDLPYGTYIIREQGAPQGYLANTSYSTRIEIREQGKVYDLSATPCPEPIIRGGVRLGKLDHDLDAQRPQGDATLEGAEFSIYLASDKSALVNGAVVDPGQLATTITTDAQGVASTGDRTLPYGTYRIRETRAPQGYLLNEGFERTFQIRSDGTVVSLGTNACPDDVIRGGIAVGKVSRETSQHVGQGEASLKGAVFRVTNVSDKAVVVDGTLYDPGSVVCSLETGENGYAATDARLLPYGTYEIREVEPPTGFLPNEDWMQTVSIREDGVIVDKSGEGDSVDDQVMRGGFCLNKVDEDSMERLGGTGFLITSLTTGENHVAVTDENGLFSTERIPHSQLTNANDGALAAGDALDTTKATPDAGIWFSGRADMQTSASDDFCALPYDSYEVRELRSEVNEGKQLVTFTVHIHEHDYFADLGTIDNKTPHEAAPRISTTLTFDDTSHVAPATQSITLVDVVVYEGLTPGKSYDLRGVLVRKDGFDPNSPEAGAVAIANASFVPTTSSGKAEMVFSFDASELAGSTVVALEYLSLEGSEVTRHEDVEDAAQTVRFPSIGTTLADAQGNHEVGGCDDRVLLVDTVAYRNLEPRKHYEMQGTLYDKTSGEKLTDANGREVTAVVSFVPDEPDGSVEVPFSLTASSVRGATLVAFEQVRRGGITIAKHADAGDVDQTVTIPSIGTELLDEGGHHTAGAAEDEAEDVTLIDTVRYTNLIVGKTYTLHGVVMDKTTGDPLCAADGTQVSTTVTVIPNSSDGVATLRFKVDRSLVAGKQVVAFETLLDEERPLAIHANIDDPAQTVSFPSIGTTLSNAAGAHEVLATERVDLVDTVAYAGLMPGETYRMQGTLMDASTGEAVRDADENDVTAEQSFVAAESAGTVTMTFVVDGTALAGKTVVAFERLVQGEGDETRPLARHEDLSDEGQTVTFPRIATTASDAEDGDSFVIGTGTVKVRDEVSYSNLRPGVEYVMCGTLYNKSNGSALIDAEGKAVTAQVAFTPEVPYGSVALYFEFDAALVSGTAVVAFESCQRDGIEVAVHADLTDKDQTVNVARICTEAHDQKTGSHEAVAAKEVTIVDTVSYEGLVPDVSYTLQGTLMDKRTGKALQTADGKAITASASFTPSKSSGSTSLTFTIDASNLADASVVVFEQLLCEERLVAAHEDINDMQQCVTIRAPHEEEKTPNKEEPKKTSTTNSTAKGTSGSNGTSSGTTKVKESTPRTGDVLASPTAYAALGALALFAARRRAW